MSEDTRQNILDCGQEEFLQKGFEGASLRSIAKAAGVTTGAIYGYFPDKKALFEALVSQPAREMLDRFMAMQDEFAALPPEKQAAEIVQGANENMTWVVDHVYRHYPAFKLLVCCSPGMDYSNYVNKMVAVETQSTFRFIAAVRRTGRQVRSVEEQLVHILVNAFFFGVFEMVVHDMPQTKAALYLNGLQEFYKAGWLKILGL